MGSQHWTLNLSLTNRHTVMTTFRQHSTISQDIQEWLLLDNKVCSHWVGLAVSLQLGHHVSNIARTSIVKNIQYDNTDRHKLTQLIHHWQTDKPKLFTVDTLLSVLRQLNLKDMEMWIRIITSRHYNHIRQEINNRRESKEYSKYKRWLSYDSLNSCSIMNISQDSGVGDINYSQEVSSELSININKFKSTTKFTTW